jgi:hypothetical protein
VVAAALLSELTHSFTSYWITWVLIASVVVLRGVVALLDRRHASRATVVRTYVRDSGDPAR